MDQAHSASQTEPPRREGPQDSLQERERGASDTGIHLPPPEPGRRRWLGLAGNLGWEYKHLLHRRQDPTCPHVFGSTKAERKTQSVTVFNGRKGKEHESEIQMPVCDLREPGAMQRIRLSAGASPKPRNTSPPACSCVHPPERRRVPHEISAPKSLH